MAKSVKVLGVCLVAALAACGGDDATEPAADTAVDTATDAGSGSGSDVADEPDAEPEPLVVNFELINGNPGGNPRWVQVTTALGTPGWWTITEDLLGGLELRPHDSCGICNCEDPGCDPCPAEPEIREIGVGESITGSWDLTLYELTLSEINTSCEQPLEDELAPSFRVQLCWSPEPPNAGGVLPPDTISCTRIPFVPGVDETISYTIEGLATCGNGECESGETSRTCAEDCTGVTPTDAVLACIPVCGALVGCRDDIRRDECEAGFCAPLNDDLLTASTECINAYVAYFTCVGALDCDGLSAFAEGGATTCDSGLEAINTACATEK